MKNSKLRLLLGQVEILEGSLPDLKILDISNDLSQSFYGGSNAQCQNCECSGKKSINGTCNNEACTGTHDGSCTSNPIQ